MNKDPLCTVCLMDGNVSICKPMDDAYLKCPSCGFEGWPADDSMVKRMRQQKEVNREYISCSLPEGVKVHGGGDPVGRGKKEAMKKKPLSRINFGLY